MFYIGLERETIECSTLAFGEMRYSVLHWLGKRCDRVFYTGPGRDAIVFYTGLGRDATECSTPAWGEMR